MKTVGSILKEAREAKRLTFEQVEIATKIRAKFLTGIEADDYSILPSVSYAKGFVKNYAEYLGVSTSMILAFFRRQTLEITKSAILPKGVAQSLNRAWFQLTPGKFLIFLFVGFVVLFLIYLGIQYGQLRNPPILAIDVPLENTIVVTKKVELLGSTDPDATVTVNGISVLVRGDGKFFDQITLEPGTNTITVIATSRYGKTSLVKRTITSQEEEANPR
ncbi:MAG: helix-turn-helix domain-containing protein [Candidatus Gottesmanbacteria bacterium]|nr:helix-turn-helix domain-containing protein [Candidatus Gottesmanbacteria bacterium]